jgi:hypothetical protein
VCLVPEGAGHAYSSIRGTQVPLGKRQRQGTLSGDISSQGTSATETEGHGGPAVQSYTPAASLDQPSRQYARSKVGPSFTHNYMQTKHHAHQPKITSTSRHLASSQTNADATAEHVHGRPAQRTDIGADSAILRHSEKTYAPHDWCCCMCHWMSVNPASHELLSLQAASAAVCLHRN